jgi:hypothetical protein
MGNKYKIRDTQPATAERDVIGLDLIEAGDQPWYNYQYQGEALKLRPDRWMAHGADPVVVSDTAGIALSYRYQPQPVYYPHNHPTFQEH